jgi:hypothetical protein
LTACTAKNHILETPKEPTAKVARLTAVWIVLKNWETPILPNATRYFLSYSVLQKPA